MFFIGLHLAEGILTLIFHPPCKDDSRELEVENSVESGINFASGQPQRISFHRRAVVRDDILRECLELIPQRASFKGMIYTSQDKEDLY